jgi:hypothetical protein
MGMVQLFSKKAKRRLGGSLRRRLQRRMLCEALETRRVLTTFSVADVQVDEASGTAAITISAQSVSSAVSVDWSTSNGTATAGSD